MKKVITLAALVLSCDVTANEHNIGIGLSGTWEQSPYVGESTLFSLLPLVDYDSQYLFMSGTSGGIHLWQNGNQQLNFALEYQSFELKPSDNDNRQVKKLDRRRTNLAAGLSYSLVTPYGQLSAEALMETLHNSKGMSVDFEYAGYLQLNERLALIPQIGVTWFSHNHNNYYYGISQQESERSGLSNYRASSGFNPYLTLTSSYIITPNWTAVFEYDYSLLSHEVKSSPIVNRSSINSFSAGVLYYF